jgi:thiosulfate reductase cytochrome b subunit
MYLYPKWIRIWHLINAAMFIILIITGISMHYTDKENAASVFESAKDVRWHNFAAVILILNYIWYVLGNLLTVNGKYYRIERKVFFSNLNKQFKFYALGMFKGEKHPFPVTEEQKFNPLQKFTYVLTMYVAFPLLILSGICLMLPGIDIGSFPGTRGFHLIHIIMGFMLSIFLIIHIYTCTLGDKPTSLFRGIISGYHVSEDE